jgi:hypothetical protein
VAATEDDVAGEHHAGVGDVDDGVARGVGGTDLGEPDRSVAHPQVELAGEGAGGGDELDPVEAESAEDVEQNAPVSPMSGAARRKAANSEGVSSASSAAHAAEAKFSASATRALP